MARSQCINCDGRGKIENGTWGGDPCPACYGTGVFDTGDDVADLPPCAMCLDKGRRIAELEEDRKIIIEACESQGDRIAELEAEVGGLRDVSQAVLTIIADEREVLAVVDVDIIHIDEEQGCIVEIMLPWTEDSEATVIVLRGGKEK